MEGSLYVLYVILRCVETYTIITREYHLNNESFIFAPQGPSGNMMEETNTLSVIHCATFCVQEKCVAYFYDKQKLLCRLFSDVICDKTPNVAIQRISFYRKDKHTATAIQVLPNPVLKYTECKDAPGVGVYTLWPTPSVSVQAYCDYGGWTVNTRIYQTEKVIFPEAAGQGKYLFQRLINPRIHLKKVFQRRLDGSLDFNKLWMDYKNGFGNVHSEYWLGNDIIHLLSSDGQHELRVELEAFDCRTKYAEYSTFYIDDEAGKYRISISGYSGTAGNAMNIPHAAGASNGMFFSTRDRDNDASLGFNCVNMCKGPWWHNQCSAANLNGIYITDVTRTSYKNVFWYKFDDPASYPPLAKTTMALRKRS